jgi:hypothetical protein
VLLVNCGIFGIITDWRLAFVADFGTQNFHLKTKFDMEHETSKNHENGNDANSLLVAAALDKLATDIVNQLDDYARDYDPYEYGLPTHDSHLENMYEIIKRLISSCH